MFVPKPKIQIKEIRKQDYFRKSGEPIPYNYAIATHSTKSGLFYWIQYRNASLDQIQFHCRHRSQLVIRRRIYIAFELRVQSKSKALGALTMREGDAIPEGFIRKIREKLKA